MANVLGKLVETRKELAEKLQFRFDFPSSGKNPKRKSQQRIRSAKNLFTDIGVNEELNIKSSMKWHNINYSFKEGQYIYKWQMSLVRL